MLRQTYNIEGLFKTEDKKEIETYLRQVEGVEQVQVNLNDQTVTVDFDSSVVQSGWLKETLQSLGHDTEMLE